MRQQHKYPAHEERRDYRSDLSAEPSGHNQKHTSATISKHAGMLCFHAQIIHHLTLGQNPSFVLKDIKQVVIEDRPIPQLEDGHDVLVHVSQTGICGSDVH